MELPISNLRLATCLLVLGAICLTPAWAASFQRTMTCTESGPYACDPGEQPKPVMWRRLDVAYKVNNTGTENVGDTDPGLSDDLLVAVTTSFETWNEVDCTAMHLEYAGETDTSNAEFNQSRGAENVNLVVWRDNNWEAVASAQTFALTSVSYNPNTGQIADADIEINAEMYPISTTDPVEANHVDLRNTLVHEVGHFIGLDHSSVVPATMYANADVGETDKRTLHEDDIEGFCTIYPLGEDPGDDGDGDGDGGGSFGGACCATTGTPAPTPLAWLGIAAGLLVVVRLRRRRV